MLIVIYLISILISETSVVYEPASSIRTITKYARLLYCTLAKKNYSL